MRITSLRSAGFIGAIAIVCLAASCKDKNAGTRETGKQAEVKVSENEKIVYINTDTLQSKYDYFKDLSAKLQAKARTAEADFQSRSQGFQREVAQYQQQQGSMAADQRAATEQRLARKEQELRAYQQNAGQTLQQDQAKENEKYFDKVHDYLKNYAKQKGFKLVLQYRKGDGAILFADGSLDVTSEVVKGLNEAYTAEKK